MARATRAGIRAGIVMVKPPAHYCHRCAEIRFLVHCHPLQPWGLTCKKVHGKEWRIYSNSKANWLEAAVTGRSPLMEVCVRRQVIFLGSDPLHLKESQRQGSSFEFFPLQTSRSREGSGAALPPTALGDGDDHLSGRAWSSRPHLEKRAPVQRTAFRGGFLGHLKERLGNIQRKEHIYLLMFINWP